MDKVTRLPELPARRPDSHKGSFGSVLAIGGSLGMSGALSLVGRGATRSGAGLVTLACPSRSQPIVAGLVPEALTVVLPEDSDGRIEPKKAAQTFRRRGSGKWNVLAAGCGWGTASAAFARDSVALIEQLAGAVDGPAVIDADGLNLLAQTRRLRQRDWPRLVITPHPGELGRLIDASPKDIQADRLAAVEHALDLLHRPVIVLKGAGTIVADGHRCYVNATGNAGLATGGAGDVLTGMIAALLAQGLEPFEAAVLGVHLHGLAGDLAAAELGEVSLTASALVDFLPQAFLSFQRKAGRKQKGPPAKGR